MDKLNETLSSFTGGSNNNNQQPQQQSGGEQKQEGGGSFLGGIGDKINTAAGGGRESEKNEDMLDKGIDYVQENVLGQGPQDNESAIEQAKDEQIANFVRDKYKSTTGSDFPIKDK
ncbi:uncharacterized protein HMPREF1541_06876 [Cyphellophora europaea CBS 101466]|uniref:DNA damage-responsive protein 48 n=1 Tax=Cyphellophora europaea (strain CBS 101466) TaxID=1220924 RepID=W2RQP6_CYPE1|nr:uncharacterized protein HMPREF1541_06876 [Cyphellophora europaea CBS 101466]ETN38836.1 hypothetical protein HMPREF1541_06876 [Cyphellophora europaea CBS 101466]